MGCLPFRREGLGDASIRSSRASTTASPVSDGTEDIAEATFLEMSRLLKSHRKAVTPSFIARLFGKQSAVLRSSVQGYLDKLRTLQATFEEQKRALPGIGFSTRTAAENDILYLFDDMRTSFRKAEQEIGYGKREASINACTAKIEQLNSELKTIFDANRPARRTSTSRSQSPAS